MSLYDSPSYYCEEHWFKNFWLAGYEEQELEQLVNEPQYCDKREKRYAQELLKEKSK
jgi:hypothetical protein